MLTSDPRPEVSVAIAEPAKDVEDQDTVLHGPAKVADGEVTLDERPEARIETQNPGVGIAQKLALERQPGPASARSVADEVVEVQGDRPQNPGEDDAIEAQPRGGRDRAQGAEEDMVVQGLAAEGEEDQVPPPA